MVTLKNVGGIKDYFLQRVAKIPFFAQFSFSFQGFDQLREFPLSFFFNLPKKSLKIC